MGRERAFASFHCSCLLAVRACSVLLSADTDQATGDRSRVSPAKTAAFDEMRAEDGVRAAYAEIERWLRATPREQLDRKRQEAELLFRRIGITFAVYGEGGDPERLIPFDIIPRIIARRRMGPALGRAAPAGAGAERLPADVYGEQEILQGRQDPQRPGAGERGLPAGDGRHRAAAAASTRISPASTWCAPGRTSSTCWRTIAARRPASPTCWRTGRRCCGCFPKLCARHRIAPVEPLPRGVAGDAEGGRPGPRRRPDGRRC